MTASFLHGASAAPVWSGRARAVTFTSLVWAATWWLASAPAALGETGEKQAQEGPVEVLVRLDPVTSTLGDPVTLTLRATAEPNVELLMPEFGEALLHHRILDFRQHDSIDADGRTVMEQVYRLDPPRSGRQSIPPIMVEFIDRRPGKPAAPEGFDAYEILTERLGFTVESVLPDDADADLHGPLATLPPLAAGSARHWPWVVGGGAVVALTIASLWPVWIRARRRARRRSAYDLALARLQRLVAPGEADPSQIDAFFVELSAIVRWYVENRFELRAPESTTEEFLAAMSRSPDLTTDHQALLRDFLHRADLVKFANYMPDARDIDASVGAARRFLDETRHAAPMLDPEAAPGPPAERPATPEREVARA